jgi:hypothetical protein
MYLKERRRRRSNLHGLAKVVMPSGVEASLDISWRHTDEITGSNVERSRLNIPTSKNLPAEGLEPTRSCDHWILSPARLPIPPRRRWESETTNPRAKLKRFRSVAASLREARQLILAQPLGVGAVLQR